MLKVRNGKIANSEVKNIGTFFATDFSFDFGDVEFSDSDKFQLKIGEATFTEYGFTNEGYLTFSRVSIADALTGNAVSFKVTKNGVEILSDTVEGFSIRNGRMYFNAVAIEQSTSDSDSESTSDSGSGSGSGSGSAYPTITVAFGSDYGYTHVAGPDEQGFSAFAGTYTANTYYDENTTDFSNIVWTGPKGMQLKRLQGGMDIAGMQCWVFINPQWKDEVEEEYLMWHYSLCAKAMTAEHEQQPPWYFEGENYSGVSQKWYYQGTFPENFDWDNAQDVTITKN